MDQTAQGLTRDQALFVDGRHITIDLFPYIGCACSCRLSAYPSGCSA